jgi:hypothetical protein
MGSKGVNSGVNSIAEGEVGNAGSNASIAAGSEGAMVEGGRGSGFISEKFLSGSVFTISLFKVLGLFCFFCPLADECFWFFGRSPPYMGAGGCELKNSEQPTKREGKRQIKTVRLNDIAD